MNVTLIIDHNKIVLEDVVRKTQEVVFTYAGKKYVFRADRLSDGVFALEQEISPGIWQRSTGAITHTGKAFRRIQLGNTEVKISEPVTASTSSSSHDELSPRAPMPGLVYKILVKRGDNVKKGQALAVMEAMKVQTTLSAGQDAVVENVLVREGDIITEGSELVRLAARGKAA